MTIRAALLYAFTLLLARMAVAVPETSPEQCLALGFEKGVTQCGTCEQVKSVLGDEEFYGDCLTCCETPAQERYERAVFELDRRMLRFHKHLQKIIKELRKHDGIEVKNRMDQRPVLRLYTKEDDESPTESVNILGWDLEMLQEFLKDKLAVES